MQKGYLLAPGPTPIPPRVLQAMSASIIHHRVPAFEAMMAEVREGLRYVFQTDREVLVFTASCTGAMEGAVSNFLSRGDKAICLRAGHFGERWAEILMSYGVVPVNVDAKYGDPIPAAAVAEALEKNPDAKAVYMQASETSTGVSLPVREIAALVRKRPDTILVVDAITALGVFPLPTDEWGVDVVIGGSQKGLMLPPGLAFAAVSEKGWKMAGSSKLPLYYFDYRKEQNAVRKNQTAFTPAVSLIAGLQEALRMIREEGLENIFARHARCAHAMRAAMQAIGLSLFATASPSNSVTAVKVPQGIEGARIVDTLRDKHGITIAGGKGSMLGKIFRIAHLGYVDKFDVVMAVAALEMTLKSLGHPVTFGKGVAAAMNILES